MTDEPRPPLPAPKSNKPRPIPAKLKICLEAMLDGRAKTMAEGAEIAGCSRQYIWSVLQKRPDALAWIQARAAKMLGIGAAVATSKMIDLLQSDSSRTSFEASRFVLGLSGFRNDQPAVSINVSAHPRAGVIIDLREDQSAPAPTVPQGTPGMTLTDNAPVDAKVIEGEAEEVSLPNVTRLRGD